MGCICISAAPANCNPGIVNTVAMESIFSFFFKACSNYCFVSEKYWEECSQSPELLSRKESNSDEIHTNNEILVTNLPLASNWIADSMVGFSRLNKMKIEECQVCLIQFSFLVRKHHCRSCGRVVCGMCSKYKMIFNNKETPYRVCCSCYFEYKRENTAVYSKA